MTLLGTIKLRPTLTHPPTHHQPPQYQSHNIKLSFAAQQVQNIARQREFWQASVEQVKRHRGFKQHKLLKILINLTLHHDRRARSLSP